MKHTVLFLSTLLLLISCGQFADHYFKNACIYEEREEYGLAIKELDKAIENDPKQLRFYMNRAWDYRSIGHRQKAIEDFRKVLQMDTNNVVALWGIGYIYYEQGQYSGAVNCFNRIDSIKGGGPLYMQYVPNSFIGDNGPDVNMDDVWAIRKLCLEKLSRAKQLQ